MNEWLENLKVGDSVAVTGGYQGDVLSRVERLTKTLIITTTGGKFRKDGHAPGLYSRIMLEEPTDEIVHQIRQAKLARIFKHYAWDKLPLETLVKVYELISEKRT